MGEAAPFDQHYLSHGICSRCEAKGIALDPAAIDSTQPLSRYFREKRALVMEGVKAPPAEWIKEGLQLHIKPDDLLIGIVQPLLYEVGELWARGEITIAREHAFTAFAEGLVEEIYRQSPGLARLRQGPDPDILLTNAEGNYHTLGIKFLELRLLASGIKAYTLLPGLPAGEILALARELKAPNIGISVSMSPQLDAIDEFSKALLKLPEAERPKAYYGGAPVREGRDLRPGLAVTPCADFADLSLNIRKR